MKRIILVIFVLLMIVPVTACSEKKSATNESEKKTTANESKKTDLEKIYDVRHWIVSDLWNNGICDMSHYYYDGTNAVGETMDANFTIEQLKKAYSKKSEYDAIMSSVSDKYSDLKNYYVKVMGQVDILYAQIIEKGATVSNEGLDTGLYNQYFRAFDDEYFKLTAEF